MGVTTLGAAGVRGLETFGLAALGGLALAPDLAAPGLMDDSAVIAGSVSVGEAFGLAAALDLGAAAGVGILSVGMGWAAVGRVDGLAAALDFGAAAVVGLLSVGMGWVAAGGVDGLAAALDLVFSFVLEGAAGSRSPVFAG